MFRSCLLEHPNWEQRAVYCIQGVAAGLNGAARPVQNGHGADRLGQILRLGQLLPEEGQRILRQGRVIGRISLVCGRIPGVARIERVQPLPECIVYPRQRIHGPHRYLHLGAVSRRDGGPHGIVRLGVQLLQQAGRLSADLLGGEFNYQQVAERLYVLLRNLGGQALLRLPKGGQKLRVIPTPQSGIQQALDIAGRAEIGGHARLHLAGEHLEALYRLPRRRRGDGLRSGFRDPPVQA